MNLLSSISSKALCITALVGAVNLAPPSQAQTDQKPVTPRRKDVGSAGQMTPDSFVKKAARDNEMEIALVEVGADKAQNPELKRYCEQIQREQIRINQDLQPIAGQHGVATDQSLTKRDESELSQLHARRGGNFDRSLMTLLLREEQRTIADLQRASAQAEPSDVQQYVQQTLPKERQEFAQAQVSARETGVNPAAANKSRTPKAVGGAE